MGVQAQSLLNDVGVRLAPSPMFLFLILEHQEVVQQFLNPNKIRHSSAHVRDHQKKFGHQASMLEHIWSLRETIRH